MTAKRVNLLAGTILGGFSSDHNPGRMHHGATGWTSCTHA